jgi:GNAT acetyltransferase-like protein
VTPGAGVNVECRPLTLEDLGPWARLLASCFEREPMEMEALISWFHEGFRLVTMGAWDGDRLVAQYNCRLLELDVPGVAGPVAAGMGLNMAVDPAYRGRGLLNVVATPVHEEITRLGCVVGVGFSSAGGLDVTRASRSYAYEVLGPMTSLAVLLSRRRYPGALPTSDAWPEGPMRFARPDSGLIRYAVTPASLRHRFARHPFRRYEFGIRERDGLVDGLVVFRSASLRGVPGVSLLAAYGDDLADLLGSFAAAMRAAGRHVVHVVVSPSSSLRAALSAAGTVVRVPLERSPYHLIARSLVDDAPQVVFDAARWDCTGGDIL